MIMAKPEKQPVADPVIPPAPPETENPIIPQLSAEQQAEVDLLAGKIAATEGVAEENPALQQPGAAIPPGSFSDDASMCVDVFVDLSITYCPQVAPLWPEDKRRAVASALGRVFEKYNFTFARFGPEIALLMVAGPVLLQTSKVIAQQMNEQAARDAEQVHAPKPAEQSPLPDPVV